MDKSVQAPCAIKAETPNESRIVKPQMHTPGVHSSKIQWSYPALAGWSWECVEIVGEQPGPRLAIIAGVHVNETSSIEAALRLQSLFDPAKLRGTVSILPLANLPAVPRWSQYVCPLDDKNINFSFPGRPDGTFSEALAHALLNDWAADADCFVDMHGGDLCEEVSHFTIAQRIGDPAFDARNLEIARCFDAQLIVQLDPSHTQAPGRSCTGRAGRRQHAAFAEAGRIGLVEEDNVLFHVEGVLRLARYLSMIDEAPPHRRAPVLLDDYLWVPAPEAAFYRYRVKPGHKIAKGDVIAEGFDMRNEKIAEVASPSGGYVLWTLTHALVNREQFIAGVGVEPARASVA
jgi:predicted deacylase